LIPGPDLYTYFLANTSQHIDDAFIGCRRALLLKNCGSKNGFALHWNVSGESGNESVEAGPARSFSLSYAKNHMEIHAFKAGALRIFSTNGAMLKFEHSGRGSYSLSLGNGLCIARFTSNEISWKLAGGSLN